VFGDAAQTRPALPTPWREVPATMAGPAVSAVLGVICFALWLQIESDYAGAITVFLAGFNLLIVIFFK